MMSIRFVGHVSMVVLWVLIASSGMVLGQQAGSSSVDGIQAGGFAQPNVGDRHIVRPFPDSDARLLVYGAAQNQFTDDPDDHVYLYEPPLRFRVVDDGTIDVRRNGSDLQRVVFYLEGMNQSLEGRIQQLLNAEEIEVLARNVRPLQYTFITLSDDSEQWRSRYPPEEDGSLPAPQDWIRFEVDFAEQEEGSRLADEFVSRLRTEEVEFNVVLGYGGRQIVRNTVELTTRSLLETNFLTDLTGDGEFTYVTRNQIRDALAVARAEIAQRVYIEDSDAIVPSLEWPEAIWNTQRIEWDDFLSRFQVETSRYGFDRSDLTPARFTRFLEHVKSEMEDESKDYIDIRASMEAEAGFLGIGGSAGGSAQMEKEEFARRMRSNENRVEWDGELLRPIRIDLFVMEGDSLQSESRIGSYVITATSAPAQFASTISSRQRRYGRADGRSDLPSGAVVAFDREDGCPPGWSEYREADGRFIVGTGRHTVHDRYATEVTEFGLREMGGERTHRLSVDEMPSHEHEIGIRPWPGDHGGPLEVGHSVGGNNDRTRIDADDGPPWAGLVSSLYATGAGGSQAHNNMPPWVALKYCRRN